jgi:hypothetical protein
LDGAAGFREPLKIDFIPAMTIHKADVAHSAAHLYTLDKTLDAPAFPATRGSGFRDF